MSDVTILDATPENSNGEECDVCYAPPSMPCVYSTNPPTARDRMHYQRVEAARRSEAARKALRTTHELSLMLAQQTDTRKPIVSVLTVTDSNSGKVLHQYELSEHDFMRMLRGGVVIVGDEMTGGL